MNDATNQETILVIEDEQTLREALVTTLSQTGLQVLSAEDGQAGLELALKTQPDVLIVDILMPQMDGMTMIKKLRQDDWGKQAKIIVLTNLGNDELIQEVMQLQVEDYIVKSDAQLSSILEKVQSLLANN